ncbi:SER-THR-PHOSPHATASE domain-containing protein [Aphelenchoides bicaudatus]|nr:SER-THR-PHOSPHATASE domain-containing protein [Aphelenchoides bicaudatus]
MASTVSISSKRFDFDEQVEKLIRDIWNFIYSYTDSAPMSYDPKIVLAVLRRAIELFEDEPTVLDLNGTVCVFGDLQGQADTLISLLSTFDLPPKNTFLFLGNYCGQGFSPHECLIFLLALKVRYPRHVYLLKGNTEDSEVLKANDFIEGLILRNLMSTSMIWLHFEKVLGLIPWAAVLSGNYFCVHGGIGPVLLKYGLSELRNCNKPASYPIELAIEQECVWSCYRGIKTRAFDYGPKKQPSFSDGSPLFGDNDIERFLKNNDLQMIIRSRQVVLDGVLNMPTGMLTVCSAAGFLDNFRNKGGVIIIDGEKQTAVINKIVIHEDEPKSLDDIKPSVGRNAIIIA